MFIVFALCVLSGVACGLGVMWADSDDDTRLFVSMWAFWILAVLVII